MTPKEKKLTEAFEGIYDRTEELVYAMDYEFEWIGKKFPAMKRKFCKKLFDGTCEEIGKCCKDGDSGCYQPATLPIEVPGGDYDNDSEVVCEDSSVVEINFIEWIDWLKKYDFRPFGENATIFEEFRIPVHAFHTFVGLDVCDGCMGCYGKKVFED